MFTGLIEAIGTVIGVTPSVSGSRLSVAIDLAGGLAVGDSLAVNGVCLTAVTVEPGVVQADIGPETAKVTTLGALRPGALVNLERPLRADGRLGGHFVQGHVDGTGRVDDIHPDADGCWLTIGYPPALAPYIVHRGSIAVDGISLTVAGLGGDRVEVQIIPFTWSHTNLKALGLHDRVNIECDMLGKFVIRAAELMIGPVRASDKVC